MDKYTKGDGSKATNGDIPFVHPINIGKGIKWNESSKQYEVNIGDGLEISSEGKVVIKKIEPVTHFDNGTGTVVNNAVIIDYGNGIIEFSGRVVVKCTHSNNNIVTTPPYKNLEGSVGVDLTSLNLKQLVSVSLTAGDQRATGVAKENAWLLGEPTPNPILGMMYVGGQIVGDPSKSDLDVFFSLKGIKA